MAAAAALLALASVLGLASSSPGDLAGPANRRGRCRQPHLDKNYTGCVVDRRIDLPDIRPDATFEVFAAEHYLSAGGKAAEVLTLTHMGLWLRESTTSHSERVSIVMEYAAIQFGAKALFPDIGPGGELVWDNWATVAWYPEANRSEWISQAKLMRAGTIDGRTLEAWFKWLLAWKEQRQGYNLWSIWDKTDVVGARRLLPDSICHTLVEDGLAAMYRLGANMDQEGPICRNYFPFIDTVSLRPVNTSDPAAMKNVAGFFAAFKDLVNKPFKNMGHFGRALVGFVMGFRHPHFYVYRYTTPEEGPTYWLANLSRPYFGLRTNQRMLLPWQNASHEKRGECRRKSGPWPTVEEEEEEESWEQMYI